MKKICILAYSGGLDTSAIILWLKEILHLDVVAYCCNIGNLPISSHLREEALNLGACDFIFDEAQDNFINNYLYPMIRANATYYDDYLLGTAISRPLIAERIAQYANKIGAHCVAHGATGKGNDHLRFERAWSYLIPNVEIIAPWKLWTYKSREELISFLRSKNYKKEFKENRYSLDHNIFHQSSEGGDLEKIDQKYEKNHFEKWPINDENISNHEIIINILNGEIVGINNTKLPPKRCLEILNHVGSKNKIGLCDIVEERTNGIKSRGIYETPGGTLAHIALKSLKQICWSRQLYSLSQLVSKFYGELIYDGFWFSDACKTINEYFKTAANTLCGDIGLSFKNGLITFMFKKSPYSLYQTELASFDTDPLNIHKASLGYSKILTLSSVNQGERDQTLL